MRHPNKHNTPAQKTCGLRSSASPPRQKTETGMLIPFPIQEQNRYTVAQIPSTGVCQQEGRASKKIGCRWEWSRRPLSLHREAKLKMGRGIVCAHSKQTKWVDRHTSFTDSDVKRKVPGAGALMFAISPVWYCLWKLREGNRLVCAPCWPGRGSPTVHPHTPSQLDLFAEPHFPVVLADVSENAQRCGARCMLH